MLLHFLLCWSAWRSLPFGPSGFFLLLVFLGIIESIEMESAVYLVDVMVGQDGRNGLAAPSLLV